jgi:CO/xanthine dehydrogenase Mo-binding subunit
LEVDQEDLEIVSGVVRVRGDATAALSLAAVAALSTRARPALEGQTAGPTSPGAPLPAHAASGPGTDPGLESVDFFTPGGSTFAYGVHAAIVETDQRTAEITVLRYCVVHDCGRVINPMLVEGQIHGGVAQGVGGALYERTVHDRDGQLVNASFMDFLMPYATEVPHPIEIRHLESPSPRNSLGLKGAGEAGVIPGAAVIASAIEDAEGLRIDAMPIQPSELFELRRRFAARPGEPRSEADQDRARR